MVVAAVVEVVLRHGLVVRRETVGDKRAQDPRRDDDAEVVVEAGDGVLGGVDHHDVLVLGAVGEVGEEGLDALVELAALVLALEQENGQRGAHLRLVHVRVQVPDLVDHRFRVGIARFRSILGSILVLELGWLPLQWNRSGRRQTSNETPASNALRDETGLSKTTKPNPRG